MLSIPASLKHLAKLTCHRTDAVLVEETDDGWQACVTDLEVVGIVQGKPMSDDMPPDDAGEEASSAVIPTERLTRILSHADKSDTSLFLGTETAVFVRTTVVNEGARNGCRETPVKAVYRVPTLDKVLPDFRALAADACSVFRISLNVKSLMKLLSVAANYADSERITLHLGGKHKPLAVTCGTPNHQFQGSIRPLESD